MVEMNNDDYDSKLRRRRNEITRTLEHVRNEQSTVEENKDWIDRAAYEGRCYLLDSLAQWYIKETACIDEALMRLGEGTYGICRGCREPIEPHRLETVPEGAFCAECQKTREAFVEAMSDF